MALIKCPDCGKEQEDTNKFCKNCGANLANIKAEPEAIEVEETKVVQDEVKEAEIGEEAKEDEKPKLDLNTSTNAEETTPPKAENKKICSKCGYELKNEKFCPKCGQSTASIVPYESKEKTCPSCGTKITTEKFCPNCGCKTDGTIKQTTNVPQKYCRNCGNPIDPKAEICPKCGVRQMAVVGEKNPVFALVLSLIFPGLGQFYNNQNKKGIILIIAFLVSWVLMFILIGFILILIVWIFGMYDAYSTAKALNNGEYVEDQFF